LNEPGDEVGKPVEIIEGHLYGTVPRYGDDAFLVVERFERTSVFGIEDDNGIAEVFTGELVRRPRGLGVAVVQ